MGLLERKKPIDEFGNLSSLPFLQPTNQPGLLFEIDNLIIFCVKKIKKIFKTIKLVSYFYYLFVL